jgi:hypothetical protein
MTAWVLPAVRVGPASRRIIYLKARNHVFAAPLMHGMQRGWVVLGCTYKQPLEEALWRQLVLAHHVCMPLSPPPLSAAPCCPAVAKAALAPPPPAPPLSRLPHSLPRLCPSGAGCDCHHGAVHPHPAEQSDNKRMSPTNTREALAVLYIPWLAV